jgi:hypothetical protein
MKKKYYVWIPRILAIGFILFLLQFSFDVFSGPASWGEKIQGFFIHSIPAFLLLITLIYSWHYPRIGGASFIVLGLIFTFYFNTYRMMVSFLIISIPIFIIGILFIFFPFISKQDHHSVDSD